MTKIDYGFYDEDEYSDNSPPSPYSGPAQRQADRRAYEKYKEFLKKQYKKDKAFKLQYGPTTNEKPI